MTAQEGPSVVVVVPEHSAFHVGGCLVLLPFCFEGLVFHQPARLNDEAIISKELIVSVMVD